MIFQCCLWYSNTVYDIPTLFMIFQHCLWYSNTVYDIPTLFMIFQHCLWYSNTVYDIPTLFMIFQHCLWYSNTVYDIPTLFMIFQHCLWYSNTVYDILTLFMIFQHCLWYSNTVYDIPTQFMIFQHCLWYSNTVLWYSNIHDKDCLGWKKWNASRSKFDWCYVMWILELSWKSYACALMEKFQELHSLSLSLSLSFYLSLSLLSWMDELSETNHWSATSRRQQSKNLFASFLRSVALSRRIRFTYPILWLGIHNAKLNENVWNVTVDFRVKFKISTPAFKTLESMPN